MTKGIRAYTAAQFNRLLPMRAELGNAGFRKAVMEAAMNVFSISVAGAATHYNFALIAAKAEAKTNPTVATLLEGLGRAEDKKGGRKPTHLVNVVKVSDGTVVLGNISKAKAAELVAAASAAGKEPLAVQPVVVVVAPAEVVATDGAPQGEAAPADAPQEPEAAAEAAPAGDVASEAPAAEAAPEALPA
jgi:serine acetyltransferase